MKTLVNREMLVSKLKQKVAGQDAGIEALVLVMLGKLYSNAPKKPLVVLLPGPGASTKSEVSIALAEALETNLVRFNLVNYANSYTSRQLFGCTKGYVGSEQGGDLPNALRQMNNSCVFLFDGIEDLRQSLWPQFLDFLDEGRASDMLGGVTAPKDTICLVASSIKSQEIGNNPDTAKEILRQSNYFSPEFLGRVNKVIAFS